MQLLQRLDLRLFGADFPFLAALFLPRRSATYFLGNTLFDTGGEAVIFFFLARSIDKVELLVFGQSDLEVVAWQRLASELPKTGRIHKCFKGS